MPSTPHSQPTEQKVAFAVDGMNCGSCVRHVGEALALDHGVRNHEVSLPAKLVSVIFDPEVTSTEAIARTLTEAGYPAKPL